jgi:hypothetical protein
MPSTLPVLVVDDTEICRMGTALMLDQLGFKCELAHNGFDALDLFLLMAAFVKSSRAKKENEAGNAHIIGFLA